MCGTRKLVLKEFVNVIGKLPVEVGPHQNISIPVSGHPDGAKHPGAKCEHGVYIPFDLIHTNRAPYCSLCNLYVIQCDTDKIYKA